MTGETLTLSLPAPLAHELGSATQDFLADLLARGLRRSRSSADSNSMPAAGCRSVRPHSRPVYRRPICRVSPTQRHGAALLCPDAG